MMHIINLESIETILMNDKPINPKVAIQTLDRYSETDDYEADRVLR